MTWQAIHRESGKRLAIELSEVAFAMENASYEHRHFFDLETGEVAFVTDEIRSELDAIDEEVYDDAGNERVPFEEVLKGRELPEWMEDAVREAAAVDVGFGTRFVEVPHAESRVGYADLEDFIETVQRIAHGGSVVDPGLVRELVGAQRRDDPLEALTPREREVLALMAEGASNAGIGRRLWVTEGTVEKHVRSILFKLRLPETSDDHRRVLAVITFLDSR